MSQAENVVKFIRDTAHATAGASDVPDVELVQRFAANRDEQAFLSIISRYGPIVWSVCRRLVGNHHDAEDAFQATFLVFARKVSGLRSGEAVGGWLYEVAYRIASRLRSSRRTQHPEEELADSSSNGALDDLTVREAEATLHEELARLPGKYRDPLVLCCFEGLSRDEAAARLGWSVNRVKHGLEQGRERLRDRLMRRGVVLGVPLLTGLLASPARAVPPPLIEKTMHYMTGNVSPPVAVSSLANGVTRAMWLSKWKWAAACGLALVLMTGGLVATMSREKANSTTGAPTEPKLARAPREPQPTPRPSQESIKPAWVVAKTYLQLLSQGKSQEARKLGSNLSDRSIQELTTAATTGGLKNVKFAMLLVNDSRVMVVTEPMWMKRQPTAAETLEHVTVTLTRRDAASPWRVIENNLADEKKVLGETGNYLEGKFPFPATDKPKEEPAQPKENWDPALEFLKLAVAEKTADALKLVVPGTISERKVNDITKIGVLASKPVAILQNDTRIEVIFAQQQIRDGDRPPTTGHIVLMLTKSKEGMWLVKDIDFSDREKVESRAQLYLGGRYNEKPKK